MKYFIVFLIGALLHDGDACRPNWDCFECADKGCTFVVFDNQTTTCTLRIGDHDGIFSSAKSVKTCKFINRVISSWKGVDAVPAVIHDKSPLLLPVLEEPEPITTTTTKPTSTSTKLPKQVKGVKQVPFIAITTTTHPTSTYRPSKLPVHEDDMKQVEITTTTTTTTSTTTTSTTSRPIPSPPSTTKPSTMPSSVRPKPSLPTMARSTITTKTVPISLRLPKPYSTNACTQSFAEQGIFAKTSSSLLCNTSLEFEPLADQYMRSLCTLGELSRRYADFPLTVDERNFLMMNPSTQHNMTCSKLRARIGCYRKRTLIPKVLRFQKRTRPSLIFANISLFRACRNTTVEPIHETFARHVCRVRAVGDLMDIASLSRVDYAFMLLSPSIGQESVCNKLFFKRNICYKMK